MAGDDSNLTIARLPHRAESSVVGTAARAGIATAALPWFRPIASCLNIASFNEFYNRRVFERPFRHLPSLPRREK